MYDFYWGWGWKKSEISFCIKKDNFWWEFIKEGVWRLYWWCCWRFRWWSYYYINVRLIGSVSRLINSIEEEEGNVLV